MSTAYETQPHFVAYLDLLAGKHLIKSEEDESLNRMHSLLQVAKDSGAHSSNAIFPKCKMKIFSDNIIIACRLTGDPAKDYSRILSAFMLVYAATWSDAVGFALSLACIGWIWMSQRRAVAA